MTGFDVVTVKMGYLEPDQYEAAADWLLALTRAAWTRTCCGWGTPASTVR